MKSLVRLFLSPSPDQAERLVALQGTFAQACNALVPVVREHRCWNRVGLHHLAYRQLRDQFPELGSQMACNAIYSVSRTARLLFQHPRSPFHIGRWGSRPLPQMRFQPTAPVYFDRHTLSLKVRGLSLFTLDGRMHFDLELSALDQARFRQEKLREIVLSRVAERFSLTFRFALPDPTEGGRGQFEEAHGQEDAKRLRDPEQASDAAHWPEYVLVEDSTESLGKNDFAGVARSRDALLQSTMSPNP